LAKRLAKHPETAALAPQVDDMRLARGLKPKAKPATPPVTTSSSDAAPKQG